MELLVLGAVRYQQTFKRNSGVSFGNGLRMSHLKNSWRKVVCLNLDLMDEGVHEMDETMLEGNCQEKSHFVGSSPVSFSLFIIEG